MKNCLDVSNAKRDKLDEDHPCSIALRVESTIQGKEIQYFERAARQNTPARCYTLTILVAWNRTENLHTVQLSMGVKMVNAR